MALAHEISIVSVKKLVSFLLWSLLYLSIEDQNKIKGPEWSSRVLTLVHGIIASLVGLRQCQVLWVSNCQLWKHALPSQYALMLWSWGYFAFDLLWCLVYSFESTLILLHHFVALIAITRFMQKPYTGCTFSCTIAILEITNPLLQTRWFLKKEGYGDTYLFYMVEITYLVTFISLRGIFGTYVVVMILTSTAFDLEEKLFSLFFYIVSIVFIYDIIGYILYKYKKEIRGIVPLQLNVTFLNLDEMNRENETRNPPVQSPPVAISQPVSNPSSIRRQINRLYP